MKRMLFLAATTISVGSLVGCSALQAVSDYNNARAGYEAYQGIEGMKGLAKEKPLLKNTDTLYVRATLQAPKNAGALGQAMANQVCQAFNQEFSDMKAHGLADGHKLQCLDIGTVPADAVIMNVVEEHESGWLMRAVQSDTIKSNTSWIAHATGTVLVTQKNPGFKSYKTLGAYLGQTMENQLLVSLRPAATAPNYQSWNKKAQAWAKAKNNQG